MLTQKEIQSRMAEEDDEDVWVQNEKTGKLYSIEPDEDNPTKPELLIAGFVSVRTQPDPKNKNGMRISMQRKNLVFW